MNTIKIGRSSDNDFVLNENIVSRHHCELYSSNNKVYIKDLDSTNGTQVNGSKITSPTILKKGDIVLLGNKVEIDWYKIWTNIWGDSIFSDLNETIQNTNEQIFEKQTKQPFIDIPSSIHIKEDHADIIKKGNDGADFKVPFLRNFGDRMGNLLGSTAGCIGSILMVLAFMTIMGLIISTCS